MRLASTLMIQGTSSHVGKSVLVTGLCRVFARRGLKVAPFKAQNMAPNSYITVDGGELGNAQAIQAQGALTEPLVEMNPILLKPVTDTAAEVIVMGKSLGRLTAKEYQEFKGQMGLSVVKEALDRLREQFDLLIIEGAGSPAEVNLRAEDIVNMTVAHLADAPVLLVGDIDPGGVFAYIVGTLELLTPEERARIKGLIINKFRGDIDLLKPGLDELEKITGVPVMGVVPYLSLDIPEEDSVSTIPAAPGDVEIGIIYLPHISNFTDFDPLRRITGVKLRYIRPGQPLGRLDALIIPGSKNIAADLSLLQTSKDAIKSLGAPVVGIGEGYAMLAREVLDQGEKIPGLGLIDGAVELFPLPPRRSSARIVGSNEWLAGIEGLVVEGYQVQGMRGQNDPFCLIGEEAAGAAAPGVWGTSLHGLFDNEQVGLAFINYLRRRKGLEPVSHILQEDPYDALADALERALDMEAISRLVGGGS